MLAVRLVDISFAYEAGKDTVTRVVNNQFVARLGARIITDVQKTRKGIAV